MVSSPTTIDLSERVAIVTGAGRGIGRGIARTLARNGARIVAADIDPVTAADAAREIRSSGGSAIDVQADVTDGASVEAMVARCVAEWGTVDILINNAGTASSHMVEEMPESEWRRVLDVNLTGPFLCSKAVLPVMKRNRYGKIVNISTPGARRISFNAGANYTAAKEGLHALTRHLAYEVADLGINVNCVSPGTTITPLVQGESAPGYSAERTKMIPRGRLATVDDTANAVLFLVSDLADYVCGIVLDVEGGVLLGWTDVATYRASRRERTARP